MCLHRSEMLLLSLLLWQLQLLLPQIYKKPLIRQKIISYERVLHLFPNLEELILIHGVC